MLFNTGSNSSGMTAGMASFFKMKQKLRFTYKTHTINPDDRSQVNACHRAIRLSKSTNNPVVVLWDDMYREYHVREARLESDKWESPQWVWGSMEFSNGYVVAYHQGKTLAAIGYPAPGYGGRLVIKNDPTGLT